MLNLVRSIKNYIYKLLICSESIVIVKVWNLHYIYLCHQIVPPVTLWVRFTLRVRCNRYIYIWKIVSLTFGKSISSLSFLWVLRFHPPTRNPHHDVNWNIVERGFRKVSLFYLGTPVSSTNKKSPPRCKLTYC
jgi:hypothetical protein